MRGLAALTLASALAGTLSACGNTQRRNPVPGVAASPAHRCAQALWLQQGTSIKAMPWADQAIALGKIAIACNADESMLIEILKEK